MTHELTRSGHVRLAGTPGAQSGNSTAAVLWLMIALVFLPIAAAHGLARYAAGQPAKVATQAGATTEPVTTLASH